MTTRPTHSFAAAFALLMLLMAAASPASAARQAAPAPEDRLITLNFGGGSAADYLAALRSVQPTINVVAFDDLSQAPMPALQLTDAPVAHAIALLNGRVFSSGGETYRIDVDGTTSRGPQRPGPVGSPIFTISVPKISSDDGDGDGDDRLVVWSVQELLDRGITPDALLTAVDTALNLFGDDGESTSVRFHRDTGLVIARAPVPKLEAIEQVVRELRSRPRPDDAQRDIREQLEELRLEIQELEDVRDQKDAQLHRASIESELIRDELHEARQQINRLEHELRHMARQLDQARLRISQQEQETNGN